MGLPEGKRNLALTGFMGTGKSAVGRQLKKLTGFRLVDVDHEIEEAEGMSISAIFAQRGEPAFRDIEAWHIGQLCAGRGQIISTGGGAVLRDDNMKALKESSVLICLMATPEEVYERVRGSGHRPLLDDPDPLGKIRLLMAEREPYYEKAGLAVDTGGKSPFEIATEILESIGWKN